MKILILGGTQFVGRHMTDQALQRGWEVTLFNRGQRNPHLFPDVEKLQGDRDGDLSALRGRRWDAAIDTSGYVPRHVSASASLLAGAVEHYTFISTISVYADPTPPHADENAPLATLSQEYEGTEAVTRETYGALKVMCERAVAEAMPGRSTIIRPGLIVGPFDYTDRFTYWIMRVAEREHPVMVIPERPQTIPLQVIDGRDLAGFTLDLTEARHNGTFNATGPDTPLTLATVVRLAENVTGHQPRYREVPEKSLLDGGVQPWVDLPLWLPADQSSMHRIDNTKAIGAGLTFTPLEQTIADIYTWRQTVEEPLRAGWTREREGTFAE